MSLKETRSFLEELVQRFDSDLDVAMGSRVDAELIQPILNRVGLDPIDEDMSVFVRERVRQAVDGRIATSVIDELTDLLIDPCRVLLEPVAREIKLVRLRASLKNARSLSDAEVDALMANFFEPRVTGGFAVGIVRAYFAQPQTLGITQTHVASTRGGTLRFTPTRSQGITRDEMVTNIEGSEYYFDINYTAEDRGDEYNVDRGEIVNISNLASATRVTNLRRFRDGAPREDNEEFLSRVQRGVGDQALSSQPGIVGSIERAFPDVRGIVVVGFGDIEMERDVIKGGGLGSIPAADTLGTFFGTAEPEDDLDGDDLTPLVSFAAGGMVSRVGPVGGGVQGWWMTLTYFVGSDAFAMDAEIIDVISDTVVQLDRELPVVVEPGRTIAALRRKELTISDIPGGIVFPNTIDGELALRPDEVHIGGKTDVYVGGTVETATASITNLSDERPLAVGQLAATSGLTPTEEDVITLTDITNAQYRQIEPGMSLVLEEGDDAGSYRVVELLEVPAYVTPPFRLRVDADMTGTQGTLAWRVVDDISQELTDPKAIRATGDDMVTAAGTATVFTTSAFNFFDAGVVEGDILELMTEDGPTEYRVDEVSTTTLVVDPAPGSTYAAVAWRVFARSEAVLPPVSRIMRMELLDTTGAPNGTAIPYRDPVLAHSRAFQNEGEGVLYDGFVMSGVIAEFKGTVAAGSQLVWRLADADRPWAITDPSDTGTVTLGLNALTADDLVLGLEGTIPGVRVVKFADPRDASRTWVGLFTTRLLVLTNVTGGFASSLGARFAAGLTSATVRVEGSALTSAGAGIYDRVEFYAGPNAGRMGRLSTAITDIGFTGYGAVVGIGPRGPSSDLEGLYDVVPLNPTIERARVGRPSVGSARTFFMDPTSVSYSYAETRFEVDGLIYHPDPDNRRQVMPALPLTTPLRGAILGTGGFGTLTDTTQDFLLSSILPGDVIEVLYTPVLGTAPLPTTPLALGGLTLIITVGTRPPVTVTFPTSQLRQDAVDYINFRMGADLAYLDAGALRFMGDESVTIDPTSTAIAVLFLPVTALALSTARPITGDQYIVAAVASNVLSFSPGTFLLSGSALGFSYRIWRYVQRCSTTEMNTQIDASGLYYFDVQLQSMGPGDRFNISSGRSMEVTGHVSDGYRLSTTNPVTSYSRAEELWAEISRTMLLVGSSDSPLEAVQLSAQNVMVTYERAITADAVQSFMNSSARRPVCSEPLVRALLPHVVNLTWNYMGGPSEPNGARAISEALADPDATLDGLEVLDLVRALSGATSVFITDPESVTGRAAPVMVVVYHDVDRRVRAVIVSDTVNTIRTQRFLPGNIVLRRTTAGGIR
jgi:hypothetical protein